MPSKGRNFKFALPAEGLSIEAGHLGQVPLVLRTKAGAAQTGNILEVRDGNDNDALLYSISAAGVAVAVDPNLVGERFSVEAQLDAADADTHIWVCPVGRTARVLAINEVHSVVGGGSAACQPRRAQGTEAPASGDLLTTATIDLTATANTVITPTLTATDANRVLAAGDRLALDFSGTLTGLEGAISFDMVYES